MMHARSALEPLGYLLHQLKKTKKTQENERKVKKITIQVEIIVLDKIICPYHIKWVKVKKTKTL